MDDVTLTIPLGWVVTWAPAIVLWLLGIGPVYFLAQISDPWGSAFGGGPKRGDCVLLAILWPLVVALLLLASLWEIVGEMTGSSGP